MSSKELFREISRATTIAKKRLSAPEALNEAFHYQRPSSFSRGLRLDFGNIAGLLMSGTASVGPNGETLHVGDFRAQTRRTFANITAAQIRRHHLEGRRLDHLVSVGH